MKKIFFLILALSAFFSAKAQFAIKTNVLADALLNVNIGMEAGVAPKWTLEMPVSLNAWTLDGGKRWKHWYVQPGARYWFCDRYSGHFVGMHLHGGQYNIGGFDGKINFLGTDFRNLATRRYQGWFVGAGASYGYAWALSKHWNVEAEIGVGYAYSRYDAFRCVGCGKKTISNHPHNYVGLTKAAANIVYLF